MYSLKEAAEAVGMGKPAILKALQKGKISGQKDEHGQWRIDPAELHRVYPPVSGTGERAGSSGNEATIGNGHENKLREQEIQFLREKLADLDRLREDERHQLNVRIEDLRRDRDDLRGERDRLLKVIEDQASGIKLLTDQSEKQAAAASKTAAERAGFFARLFGGRAA